MADTLLEIERKFLIAPPDPAWLAAFPGARRAELAQTYLLSPPEEERRVRRWEEAGEVRYFHTVKREVTPMTREETERTISREDYEALLTQADPHMHPLTKTRWRLPYRGQVLEIDFYDLWPDRILLEIELSSEDQPVELPPELTILREVTGDPLYKNAALAARR